MTDNQHQWLFNNATLLLLELDQSLVCHHMTAGWRKRLAPQLSEKQAIPASELIDFESAPELLKKFESLLVDGDSIVNTPVGLRLSDQILPVLLDAWREQRDDSASPCVVVVATHCVINKDAMEVAQLQTRHSQILNAAGEGIYGLDANGLITFGNSAASSILGWRTENVLGQKAHDVHHHSYPDGSSYPRDDCPIYAALRDGEVHNVDNEVFWHADGSAIPVEYTSTPILRDGKPDGAVVVFREISKRIEMEKQQQAAYKELANLKTTYQQILDSAGEGIHGLDSQGRITFGNHAAESIVGWKTERVIGQKSHDVHHHSYPDGSPYPRENCPIYAALTDGKIHRVDNEVFWHADGTAVPVEYTSTPIIKHGEPDGAVVVFKDISERLQLEQQRESAFEEIKQLKEQLEQERDYLRDEVNTASNYGEIVGESQALKRTLSQIEAVATTPANVLILGESGTGKELVARAIHLQSDRAEKPLVKVNCASIPEDLFESEFFGHVKGAFTGAHKDRTGRMQLADGGTLFLDEVGEIPLSQQGKLLRALQEHEFERVGDDKTIKANVRVVAATNRDLEAEVDAGRFRQDLYYRLCVFPVKVPTLRERVEDIAALAMYFIKSTCAEFGRSPLKLSAQQAEALKKHHWRGNIRELKNVIERSVILSTGDRIFLDISSAGNNQNAGAEVKENIAQEDFVTDAEFRQMEQTNMTAALRHADWQVWGDHGAAKLLGIKPSTLSYRMKMFGIGKP